MSPDKRLRITVLQRTESVSGFTSALTDFYNNRKSRGVIKNILTESCTMINVIVYIFVFPATTDQHVWLHFN